MPIRLAIALALAVTIIACDKDGADGESSEYPVRLTPVALQNPSEITVAARSGESAVTVSRDSAGLDDDVQDAYDDFSSRLQSSGEGIVLASESEWHLLSDSSQKYRYERRGENLILHGPEGDVAFYATSKGKGLAVHYLVMQSMVRDSAGTFHQNTLFSTYDPSGDLFERVRVMDPAIDDADTVAYRTFEMNMQP